MSYPDGTMFFTGTEECWQMKKNEKTNVMRLLDNKQIVYESHFYEDTKAIS